MVAAPAFAQRDGGPVEGSRDVPAFVPGSMWVKLDEGVPAAHDATMRVVRALAGAETTKTFWLVPGLHLVRVPVGSERAMVSLVRELEGVAWTDLESYGAFAQSGSTTCVQPSGTATDDNVDDQWWVETVRLDEVWAELDSAELPEIVVAVTDSGVNFNHPELIDSRWENPGEYGGVPGVDDDANGIIDDLHAAAFLNSTDPCTMIHCAALGAPYCTDCDRGPGYSGDSSIFSAGCDSFGNVDDLSAEPGQHGTACATIIAAAANEFEVRGFACNIRIMGVRLWHRCSSADLDGAYRESNYVDALQYAIQEGAKVVSNSTYLRAGGGDGAAMMEAIQELNDYDVLFVNGAGNLMVDLDLPVPQPPPTAQAFVPQQVNDLHVLQVGGVEENETIWIEGTGPIGSNFGDIVVDLMAPSRAIRVLDGNDFGSFLNGTSFAAPIVAGAAALYWSLNPTATAADVAKAIKSTVRVEPWLVGTCETGGILDVATLLGY